MPNKIYLAENLRRLAKEREISAVSLAAKTNSNKSTVHNYFTGSLPQTVMTLKKIADFFGVELDDLVFKEISSSFKKERFSQLEGRYELIIKKRDSN